MTVTTVSCELKMGILTVTLDRADKLNAFNTQMRNELLAAFDRADADDEVRAVIVTGAGRAFCAGGEVAPQSASETAPRPPGMESQPQKDEGGIVTLRVFRSLKPVIGAINGAAIGFGATLPLAMDIRLASERARFGFVFTGLGVVPEACSSWFLPRIVGVSRALEWCLSAELISATEALQAGLVRSVHPVEQLLDAARSLALRIAKKSAPVSAALTRQMIWRLSAAEHPMAAHRVESLMVEARKGAQDMQEGIASFLGKREAIFPDRVSRDLPAGFPWWTEPRFERE
jgi:enoyl-CoA hydratase/carnithine racemase